MNKLILSFAFIGLLATNTYSQKGGMHKGQNRNNSQQEFNHKDKKPDQKKILERQNEKILLFINDLNVDAFQKEIIKQRLQTYSVEFKNRFSGAKNVSEQEEFKDRVKKFNQQHFKDLKDITTPETQTKVNKFVNQLNQNRKEISNKKGYKQKGKGKGKQKQY